MNDHVAMLRDLLDDFGTRGFTAERAALDAAIRALSADRGEAVARVVESPESLPFRKLAYLGKDLPVGTELYAATPPSPAESAEGAKPHDFTDAYVGAREDLLDWKRRAQVAEAELRKLGYTGIVPTEPPAAPSQVSALVPSNWLDPLLTGSDGIGDPPYDCPAIERLLNGIRKRIDAAQTQPGRVEGMGDGLQGHAGTIVGWLRDGVFIGADADDNVSSYMDRGWQAVAVVPPSTVFALPELATPTAGGDA